jgi:hypothetical protein
LQHCTVPDVINDKFIAVINNQRKHTLLALANSKIMLRATCGGLQVADKFIRYLQAISPLSAMAAGNRGTALYF